MNQGNNRGNVPISSTRLLHHFLSPPPPDNLGPVTYKVIKDNFLFNWLIIQWLTFFTFFNYLLDIELISITLLLTTHVYYLLTEFFSNATSQVNMGGNWKVITKVLPLTAWGNSVEKEKFSKYVGNCLHEN